VSCVLFVGPTAWGLDLERWAARVDVRGPACRGAIDALLSAHGAPRPIALVDGLFGRVPALGHREILSALEAGWPVWGLSSLGAIRAAEMDYLGMRGYGRIYARYASLPDLRDDEVALLHEAERPWRPVSEPLVHLREALAHLVAVGSIEDGTRADTLATLERLWFGERTRARLLELLVAREGPGRREELRAELRRFERFRVKTHDLSMFLEEAPWART